jgi:hypothetical protein
MRPNETPQQQQQHRWPSSTGEKNLLLLKSTYSIRFCLVPVRQPPPLLPPISGQLPRV